MDEFSSILHIKAQKRIKIIVLYVYASMVVKNKESVKLCALLRKERYKKIRRD